MTWNILTAGPSAGKSSTIRELAARGHRTAPEAARIVLDQAVSEGKDPDKMREDAGFHGQVEAMDARIMRNMPDDETVFFDRSIADNIAYRQHFGNEDNEVMSKIASDVVDNFDNVFLLDRIEFHDDNVRSEDEEEAEIIHHRLRNVYQGLGFDVIEVPVKPVNQRADLIEQVGVEE